MYLGDSTWGGGRGSRNERRQVITTRMRLAKKLVRETKLHGQTYTMVGFRADYKSHCESSMAVLLFKNKCSI